MALRGTDFGYQVHYSIVHWARVDRVIILFRYHTPGSQDPRIYRMYTGYTGIRYKSLS